MTLPLSCAGRAVEFPPTFDGWRIAARQLLVDRVHPATISWEPHDDAQRAFEDLSLTLGSAQADEGPRASEAGELRVSRQFLRLAATVACHRSPNRWATLYRVLWRLAGSEPHVLEIATDADVHALGGMERAVRRAAHKMKAFVRFRRTTDAEGELPVYVAWFEPMHLVVERTAPFFAERFPSMHWSILTPDACAHWDRATLRFTPGVPRAMAPAGDDLEELWRTYYAHIFNPARLNLEAMRSEMPQQYWNLLPEARLIGDLARDAPRRVTRMLEETLREPEVMPSDLQGQGPSANPVAFARALHAGAGLTRREAEIRAREAQTSSPGTADPLHDPGAFAARDRERRVVHDTPRGLALPNGGTVRLGVAGWTDPSLTEQGVFYPDDATTPEARLRYYASRFSLVEVDATYYSLPTRELAQRWAERTPDGFTFDIKAHALMTGHGTEVRRLPPWIADALPARLRSAPRVFPGVLPAEIIDEVWRRFLDALEPLRRANKLGAVLLQFPPWFKPSPESADAIRVARARLGDTLGAVEFRQRGWLAGRVADRSFQLLEELGLAYVIVDAPQGMDSSVPPTLGVTSPKLAIVRLHGRRADTWEKRNDIVTERYRYLYDDKQLGSWTMPIVDIAKRHQGVHVVFNNNHGNYATTNALELGDLLLTAGMVVRAE
ncbi:MAG TPA: TIGR03915 family putative DNA repair protein [Gemmatimonadaceae bacterium]|nr:TIGR03915 family putative DNA repair protein [Gemmatimonadaceae bacterium]